MKKIRIVPVIAAVMLIVVFVLVVTVVRSGSPSRKIAQHMKLAERYLSELDYEKAIAEYEAVISIDQKNTDAYLGMADAYTGQGKYEDAMAVLEEGYRETGDEGLSDKLVELKMLASSTQDTGSEVNVEFSETESSENDSQGNNPEDVISEENDSEEESESVELLNLMAESLEAENWDAVFDYMRSEEYSDILNNIDESEDYHIWETDGRKMGIYKIERTELCGSYMVYIGDYQNDTREGMGYWFGCHDEKYYHAYGEWKNGKPNGNQEAHFWEVARDFKHVGVVINGLWDGTVEESDNGVEFIRHYPYDQGKPVIEFEDDVTLGGELVHGYFSGDAVYRDIPDFTYGIVGFATVWID